MNSSQQTYVFENLIHANENNDLGKTITVKPAESFPTQNAPCSIDEMDAAAIAARAKAFGARCKAVMDSK